MSPAKQPRGDSHGTLGETVVPLRLAAAPLRSLRERQLALLVLCAGILVSVVDGSAVYVALPSIQKGLGFSQLNLAWVVSAYLIPFGGLLLFAGRLGDIVGTKRVFVCGLALFTAASVACGLAGNQAVLIAARFFQGAGGALTTAVVLSMIVTMFPKPHEQAKAIGLYAFIASSGAAIGLLAGGVLTQLLSWHWIFFVNVPIGAVTVVFALRLLDNERDARERHRIDGLGAVTLVGSLMLGVYTIWQATDRGWGSVRMAVLSAVVVLLLAAFVGWQTKSADPLIPPSLLRARNVGWSNLVLALMVIGPAGMFFLGALYLRGVLGFTVIEVGLAFLPTAVAVGVGSLKIAPRLLRHVEAKLVLIPAIGCMAVALALLARLPAGGHYLTDVLPAVLLMGAAAGLATPPVLQLALAEATTRDSGVRSGLLNTTQQIGSALGIAVLAPVATKVSSGALARGDAAPAALTHGYHAAFLVALGITLAALLLAVTMVQPEVPRNPVVGLDPATKAAARTVRRDPTGADEADFVALGLGGTNMMAMLWSIASGRRAVGVELRGDPFLNVMHWNVREDVYHHLAIIDRLMVERYGEERIPHRADGKKFRLNECLYFPGARSNGDARADEVLSGWAADSHAAGVVQVSENVDDRWVDGKPHRSVTAVRPPVPATEHGPGWIGRDMTEVLTGPAAFQIGAEELLIIIRRYLQEMERMDLAAGVPPRCRIFIYHRVVPPTGGTVAGRLLRRLTGRAVEQDGFGRDADGRLRLRVEAIRELDDKGRLRRVRVRGTEALDLGTPELVVIAQGVNSGDAKRLGFTQRTVPIDHHDGRGPVPAQADYIMGLIGVYVDNNCRRRVASVFDPKGNEYWVRQVGIGHEGYVESGWILAEVPDFLTFSPVEAGLVPPGTSRSSAEYYGAFRHLVREYYLEQASALTQIPKETLAKTYSLSSPRFVSVVRRIGADALVAANTVVAGDTFGNGSFLTSGGANTGMIGHASRVYRYWQARDAGTPPAEAIRRLADGIKEDTEAWLRVSEEDFSQPPARRPNARHAAGGDTARAEIVEAARRHRRSVDKVDHRDDWSRLHVFPGRLHMLGLQPLENTDTDTGPADAGSREAGEKVSVGP
jgi:EmrB/QacA subfamily drug resistance transporter